MEFQSTPSARRATNCTLFNAEMRVISIHALREEGDPRYTSRYSSSFVFQSTPSARRATQRHALFHPVVKYFNPRPPRGGRQEKPPSGNQQTRNFNPRPPRGGRPTGTDEQTFGYQISIHALREEGDECITTSKTASQYFNPRPPRGGRPVSAAVADKAKVISIHALREEGDAIRYFVRTKRLVFQSTPSARRATAKAAKKSTTFVPLYTLVHNLKRNFTKAPAKCKTNRAKVSVFAVRSARGNHGSLCLARRGMLEHQHVILRKIGVQADMLHLALVVVAQLIEPQAVQCRVDQRGQLGLQNGVLRSVQQALEHRVLHPLAVVDAFLRHLAQALAACRRFGVDVVGDENQHEQHLTSRKTADIRPDRPAKSVPAAAPAHRAQAPS